MTIEYSIASGDAFWAYFQQLGVSSAFRSRMITLTAAVMLAYILPRILLGGFGPVDIVVALIVGAAFIFLLLPLLLRLRTKTQQRTLTVSAEGLATTIGTLSGTLGWAEVADVADSPGFIFIIGQTGNSFMIPSRAFATPEQRRAFRAAITTYRSGGLL